MLSSAEIVSWLLDSEETGKYVGIVLLRHPDSPEVLIIKRGGPPEEGKWACPGGHIDDGESAEDAAHRELEEETGLTAKKLRLLMRDGSTSMFCGFVSGSSRADAEDDAEKAKWVSVDSLPKLAFDNAAHIEKAVGALREIEESEDSKKTVFRLLHDFYPKIPDGYYYIHTAEADDYVPIRLGRDEELAAPFNGDFAFLDGPYGVLDFFQDQLGIENTGDYLTDPESERIAEFADTYMNDVATKVRKGHLSGEYPWHIPADKTSDGKQKSGILHWNIVPYDDDDDS